MGKNEYLFLAVDRAHERQGEADDDLDAAVAAESRKQAEALRVKVASGDVGVLDEMAEAWAHKVSQPGVTEQILLAAARLGSAAAGALIADLLQKCIDDAAEAAAVKVVEARSSK